MSSNLTDLKSEQVLVQDILKRLNNLEIKKPVQEQVLNDYSRNFDVLNKRLKSLHDSDVKHYNDINSWCRYTLKAVENNHLVFDADSIKAFVKFLESETQSSLRVFMAEVQTKAINGSFKDFDHEVRRLTKEQDRALSVQRRLNYNVNQMMDNLETFGYAFFFMIAMLLVVSIPMWIWSFANHPVFTLLFLGLFGGLSWFGYNRLKDLKSKDDEDE